MRNVTALVVAMALAGMGCALVGGLGDFKEVDAVPGGPDASTSDAPVVTRQDFGTIGGTVTNLQGSGLILKDNGADDLMVTKSGPFVFPAKVKSGDAYAVTVASQPSAPAQTCTVTNGTGTVDGADVTNVAIDCSTTAYTVGGTVVGLSCSGLVLSDNGGDDLTIPSSGGPFTFATKVGSGAPYAVTVKTQPTGCGPCVVSGGTGTVGQGDVGGVVVNCAPGTYTVGGTVTGLVGTVVLQDNGGSNLTLTSNGSFAFSQTLMPAATYAVTVLTQPGYPPRSQTCTVTNGTGTMGSANVTNVAVACTTNSFTVGGNVTGLSGSVVLKDNGGDALTVSASGAFTFATKVASGSTYAVTIGTQPSGQVCSVASGSGTVGGANVTNVAVTCAAGTGDTGIKCDTAGTCTASTQVCCRGGGVSSTCVAAPGSCPAQTLACDDAADCAASGGVCCAPLSGSGTASNAQCVALASCTGTALILCDPAAGAGACPTGKACTGQGSKNMSGYSFCQ